MIDSNDCGHEEMETWFGVSKLIFQSSQDLLNKVLNLMGPLFPEDEGVDDGGRVALSVRLGKDLVLDIFKYEVEGDAFKIRTTYTTAEEPFCGYFFYAQENIFEELATFEEFDPTYLTPEIRETIEEAYHA